ncbi:tRNA (adenosine(37)-N6)-threonylcarbamoyltransferase complex dimerization subunit type 1 TsaB [Solirubrobacter sp. CPCC 204708]|uniref:N(6)-L-threonylcarbamoyladenine synthase n=1 Tax=Solirubrobacter deserti TaxID=2282478 RepID=A0ABT4RW87_9ACTN|nr:tRNA (adenosine(37)-N6)-threonylcarbamoyltransferase complex dimerization subunit type 1 TsaB [Solirubrobacter deserti]MBE2316401.1 tRNA (adenosine(37)-N6)-threonylcarbamoyltransferase complex dimerization subunit type 1 TsaB [Solirubrobacter deserti]MDA0142521.1 tRNA (adenosine(37)-N6)-threonylcarbamoyltransferase complex dimerization subunit type 1 TsaB [Solirubrobacter deserti]
MTGAIVGIDTATRATAVAVLVPGGREVERRDDPAPHESPRHAQVLQPLLEQALEQAAVTWDDVATICVGVGPGGFTGLRLGISTARALAQGHDLPVVGVSTLEALGRGVELATPKELDLPGAPEIAGPVLAVLDARRGEVFAAIYRHHRVTMEPSVFTPADLAERVAARREWGRSPMLGVGDGAVRFRSELERSGVAVPSDSSRAHRVSALMVARLGRAREPVDRDALLPDYLREPDAVPPKP